MTHQRTGGMTAIGILNIVFGSIGALVMLLFVLGGSLLAAGGAAMEAEMGAEANGMGAATAAGGGLIMVIGVVGLICWTAMIISGIGVLKLKSWGRTLSMVCGGIVALLSVYSLTQQFSIMNVAFLVYGGLLVGLFMKSDWKAAFGGGTGAMMEASSSPIPSMPSTTGAGMTGTDVTGGEMTGGDEDAQEAA